MGFMPNSFTLRSDINTTAAAPSLRCEAFPAVTVPFGLNTPDEPNISSTRWRTVFDHKRKLYFFESALTPNTFWVDLKTIDFSKETGKVKRLDLGENQDHTYSGDATKDFKEAKPFIFLGLH